MGRLYSLSRSVTPWRLWPRVIIDLAINECLASAAVPIPARVRLLRLYGMQVDKSAVVESNVRFGGKPLVVGPGAYVNHSSLIDAHVTIGARCGVAPGCKLITSTHEPGDHHKRFGRHEVIPIHIGDGVWVGAGATILPGVSVGDGCIIAAGAVVTSDCAPDGLYAGVPAKRIRDLT